MDSFIWNSSRSSRGLYIMSYCVQTNLLKQEQSHGIYFEQRVVWKKNVCKCQQLYIGLEMLSTVKRLV